MNFKATILNKINKILKAFTVQNQTYSRSMVTQGDEETGSGRDGMQRGRNKLLGMIGTFAILIWVMVLWVHNKGKHQILSLNMDILFDVTNNYNSMKMLKEFFKT